MNSVADPRTASIKDGFGFDHIRKIKHNSGDVRVVYFPFCKNVHYSWLGEKYDDL